MFRAQRGRCVRLPVGPPPVRHHQQVEESSAPILSRAGNWAVVHLPGRKFPGLHLQDDTFVERGINLPY
jgi:hypothetical protein